MKLPLAFILLFALSSSQGAEPEWFNHGLAPVETGFHTKEELSAQNCRSCHEGIYRDWAKSRHAASATNGLFHEGYLVEPKDRCLFCHSPLVEQLQEVRTGEIHGGVHGLGAEGVTCVACHVRSRHIYTPGESGVHYHPYESDAELRSPEFCAGCHQFDFSHTTDGRTFLTSLTVQNTYREWLDYRRNGGEKTCQECHMPGGRHEFMGSHRVEFLRSALGLEARAVTGGYEFVLRSLGVGHALPSGDLFRHLSLEVAPRGGPFTTIHTVGREFAVVIDPDSGESFQRLTKDTSLAPGEARKIVYPYFGPIRYRLVYHYTSPRDEERSLLPKTELSPVLFAGKLDGS